MTKASNVHKINPDAVRARYNASKAEKTENFVDDVSDSEEEEEEVEVPYTYEVLPCTFLKYHCILWWEKLAFESCVCVLG